MDPVRNCSFIIHNSAVEVATVAAAATVWSFVPLSAIGAAREIGAFKPAAEYTVRSPDGS
jgi:hypothetical protein